MLKTFTGIGDTGADIFYARSKTLDLGTTVFTELTAPAKQLGLPTDPKKRRWHPAPRAVSLLR